MNDFSFFSLIKRILLYQILIYFSISKFDNLIITQKEFFDKLNTLLADIKFKNLPKINIQEDDDIIFRIILISIITISFLSILNFNSMKFLSGVISITIGLIYYNPCDKINNLLYKNILLNIVNIKESFLSSELLVYVSVGIAMIYQSIKNLDIFYYLFCCCFLDSEDKRRRRKNKRKCKINCQFEYGENLKKE